MGAWWRVRSPPLSTCSWPSWPPYQARFSTLHLPYYLLYLLALLCRLCLDLIKSLIYKLYRGRGGGGHNVPSVFWLVKTMCFLKFCNKSFLRKILVMNNEFIKKLPLRWCFRVLKMSILFETILLNSKLALKDCKMRTLVALGGTFKALIQLLDKQTCAIKLEALSYTQCL